MDTTLRTVNVGEVLADGTTVIRCESSVGVDRGTHLVLGQRNGGYSVKRWGLSGYIIWGREFNSLERAEAIYRLLARKHSS